MTANHRNHPFVDGNKRTAHAAMKLFLLQNGFELFANEDEQFQIVMDAGKGLVCWVTVSAWLESQCLHRKAGK